MTRYLFDSELEELNNEMIEMGSLIEKAIEAAIQALIMQDTELQKRRSVMMKLWIHRREK